MLCNLLDQRDDLTMQIKGRESELANNGRLLSDGQNVWQRYGDKGHSVKWKGVRYTPQELRDQLRLLFDEHPILQATVDQLHKGGNGYRPTHWRSCRVANKIVGETALMSSKIALVRAGELTGDLDRVIASVDSITTAAESNIVEVRSDDCYATHDCGDQRFRDATGPELEPAVRAISAKRGQQAGIGQGRGSTSRMSVKL